MILMKMMRSTNLDVHAVLAAATLFSECTSPLVVHLLNILQMRLQFHGHESHFHSQG